MGWRKSHVHCTRSKHSEVMNGIPISHIHPRITFHCRPPPITRVDLDVLWLIFRWAVAIDKHNPRAALTLSHVSQFWRFVALRSPYIWSFIHLKLNQIPTTSTTKHRLGLLYRERSRDLPISLRIQTPRCFTEGELFAFFSWPSHRIREIDVRISTETLSPLLWLMSLNHMPRLESLVVRGPKQEPLLFSVTRIPVHESPHPTLHFGSDCPESQVGRTWMYWFTPGVTCIRLSHIELLADDLELDALLIGLSRTCATLETLEIHGCNFDPEDMDAPDVDRLIFPRLTRLAIGYYHDVAPFLQWIQAPALKELCLRNLQVFPQEGILPEVISGSPEIYLARQLFEFIGNHPSITYLCLYGVTYPDADDVFTSIHRLKMLETLELYDLDGAAFSVALSGHDPLMLPKLTSLRCTDARLGHHLPGLLAARKGLGLPLLQTLWITYRVFEEMWKKIRRPHIDMIKDLALNVKVSREPAKDGWVFDPLDAQTLLRDQRLLSNTLYDLYYGPEKEPEDFIYTDKIPKGKKFFGDIYYQLYAH